MNLILKSKIEILDSKISLDNYGTWEEPLFLAKDVQIMMQYEAKPFNKIINKLDVDEKVLSQYMVGGIGRRQHHVFLTEYGLYEVLMLSRKPIAKEFKKKIFDFLKAKRKNEIFILKIQTEGEVLRFKEKYENVSLNVTNTLKENELLKKQIEVLNAIVENNKLKKNKNLMSIVKKWFSK